MQRRTRLTLITMAVVLALLVLALGLTARALLKPARFTALLQNFAADAGLVLHVDGPAEPELWPQLAVRLHGLRLRLPAANTSLLAADEVLLVVPWRSLLGGAPAISQLQLQSPRVDLDQVKAWLAQRPAQPLDSVPGIPDIDTGVQIRDGQLLRGNALLLRGISLSTGKLANGQPFHMQVQAHTTHSNLLSMNLFAVPQQDQNQLRLSALKLTLASGDKASLSLTGHVQWRGGNRFDGALQGTLLADGNRYHMQLAVVPPTPSTLLMVQLVLNGDNAHADLHLAPKQLLAWWQTLSADAATTLALPPVQGSIQATKVDLGSMHIEGLRIDSGPVSASSLAPAVAASVAQP
ncbi:MAG: membrane assembly protein AsmA [Xanthomonadales bacterium]|nr:membrane assembly protein AsmA [Xanthomonadales bacterium]